MKRSLTARLCVRALAAFALGAACVPGSAQQPAPAPPLMTLTPNKADGVYKVGYGIRWLVKWNGTDPAPAARYTIKTGGLTDLGTDDLRLTHGSVSVGTTAFAANTYLLQVTWDSPSGTNKVVDGVVADPGAIKPASPEPADFESFWKSKIGELEAVPMQPVLQAGDSGKPGVDYWKLTLDNIRGTHIQAQIARPAVGKKFPALLILQWAGVYGLQKGWVSDRAADGWLALNLEPHDIPIDNPANYYTDQAAGPLKNYWNIGNDNRDQSYYLRMYLSCYRAIEYLKTRPDWDGKTLVVTGTSQGGQQTLMLAGLHPQNVTAAVALVPAACDMLAPSVGRASGFPNWYFNTQGKDVAAVHDASRYYDPVNFARRIKCPVLIGLGLADETASPASVLAAVNVIRAPKEIMLLRSGHQDVNGSQQPFNKLMYGTWLPALAQGKAAPISQRSHDLFSSIPLEALPLPKQIQMVKTGLVTAKHIGHSVKIRL